MSQSLQRRPDGAAPRMRISGAVPRSWYVFPVEQAHGLEIEDISIEASHDQAQGGLGPLERLHPQMRRQLGPNVAQLGVESENLVVVHWILYPARSLQNYAKLLTELDLDNRVADGCWLRVGPGGRQHLRVWTVLLIIQVVRQLCVAVVLQNHAGQRYLMREEDVQHPNEAPGSASHFLESKWRPQ